MRILFIVVPLLVGVARPAHAEATDGLGALESIGKLAGVDLLIGVTDVALMFAPNGGGKQVYGTIETIVVAPQALFAGIFTVAAVGEGDGGSVVVGVLATGYLGLLTAHGIVEAETGGTHCCQGKPRMGRSLRSTEGSSASPTWAALDVALGASMIAIDHHARHHHRALIAEAVVAVPAVAFAAADPNALTISVATWAVGLAAHRALEHATHRKVHMVPTVIPGGAELSFASRF
jgi:hypothetical protein